MSIRNVLRYTFALAALAAVPSTSVQAGVITSPGGGFTVGLTDAGNLFDSGPYIGFQRNSDLYDPISPGTPREGYGVSAGAVSGFADPEYLGVVNITGVSATYGASTATIVTQLDNGSGPLLTISQFYEFAAENVLRITVSITNVSGAAQAVLFAREVDHDINPAFETTTEAPAPTGPILDASFYGFESADPLVPYGSSVGTGGSFGPDDLGAGMKIDLGILGAGATSSFYIYEAISRVDQDGTGSAMALRSQLAGLGASYIMTSIEGDGTDPASKAAALAYGPLVAAVPEPATIYGALACGLAAVATMARRRRNAQ